MSCVAALERRQAVRTLGRRFRRDPAAYLRSLEESLIKADFATLVFFRRMRVSVTNRCASATSVMWWCQPDPRPRLVLRHPQVALARPRRTPPPGAGVQATSASTSSGVSASPLET